MMGKAVAASPNHCKVSPVLSGDPSFPIGPKRPRKLVCFGL
jgi:hypothetical protein